jgi:hypothetical protein
MPRFLTAARIKASVETLADTRGKAALLDFLIVKRTLVIAKKTSIAITQGQPAYVQATAEIAGVLDSPKIPIKAPRAIFNVFASQDGKQGFRSGKYISNGTGSTIGGNPWQSVIELSSDNPRKASLRPGHDAHLADLLLKSAKGDLPKLGDVAIFHFRHRDIETVIGVETDSSKRYDLLVARFTADFGLTTAEITALFDNSGGAIENADLNGVVADPAAYLPGLSTTATPASIGKACSLDLVTALAAKPFVILSGPSGTGKSRSTLRLAEQLQDLHADQVDGQIFQLVAIGPDWTSPKKLLGFRTPFGQLRKRPKDGSETNESYEITETLRIILRACHPSSTKIPHFLVLDEMNLSHIERYFAPFLSLMEASNILEDGQNAPIVDRQSLEVISELLDIEDKDSPEAQSASLLVKNGQPLVLPPNLFYVGTVNIDETTHMFSPKVLDRAHVIEIKALKPSDYISGGSDGPTIDLSAANQLLREAIDSRELGENNVSNPAAILDLLATKHGIDPSRLDQVKSLTIRTLDGCFKLLGPTGFEFAFRVDKEVYSYMYVWTKAQLAMGVVPASALDNWVDGLDRALFQKVLPKIHGNRSILGESLKALAAFLDGGHGKSDPAARYTLGSETSVEIDKEEAITLPAGAKFTLCRAKLLDMHARLVSRNHVSFVK